VDCRARRRRRKKEEDEEEGEECRLPKNTQCEQIFFLFIFKILSRIYKTRMFSLITSAVLYLYPRGQLRKVNIGGLLEYGRSILAL
jgi:hypothetical protein